MPSLGPVFTCLPLSYLLLKKFTTVLSTPVAVLSTPVVQSPVHVL